MRNLVVRVSIVASLSGCAMNPEAAERFAAALAGASQAYNLGYAMGGGQPLAPRQQDWDWAWDQFYSDGYLAWACRGMQTGKFSEDWHCSTKIKTDYTWPQK